MTEIAVKVEEWSSLKVLRAVEHGARVAEGDVILELETAAIDRAIDDMRRENALADLALKGAELALAQAEQTKAMDLAAAERAARQAEEDLQRYLTIEAPLDEKEVHFGLKRTEQYLAYELEELKQLEKMYAADDLTEETEEIVLKRQRDAVENAQFSLEQARIQRDKALQVALPRAEIAIREATRRAVLAWERAREDLPRALERQRIDFEKAKLERARAEEKLTKLVAARAAMTVKAPAAGIAYYGSPTRGVFADAQQAAANLRPGAAVQPGATLMTIVRPRPIFIRATVPEKELANVRAGVRGRATPAGYPDRALATIVRSVEAIPTAPGSFGAFMTVETPPEADSIVPGMTCRVKLVASDALAVLTVPPTSLVPDEENPGVWHVFVLGSGDKPERRTVQVGRRTEKKVEIKDGLCEGEKVLIAPPSAEAESL
jgi:multidrug efflux pump subunit AcrA (membrane-fusion protein)